MPRPALGGMEGYLQHDGFILMEKVGMSSELWSDETLVF